MPRTRKSPRSKRLLLASIGEPDERARAGRASCPRRRGSWSVSISTSNAALPAELLDHVLSHSVTTQRLADRPAALADDRAHLDVALEHHAERAPGPRPSASKSRFWPGPMPPLAMPPTAGTPGRLSLMRSGTRPSGSEGVGQQQQARPRAVLDHGQPRELRALGVVARRVRLHANGTTLVPGRHAAQADSAGPCSTSRSAADDALAGAADQHPRAGQARQARARAFRSRRRGGARRRPPAGRGRPSPGRRGCARRPARRPGGSRRRSTGHRRSGGARTWGSWRTTMLPDASQDARAPRGVSGRIQG